MSGFCLNYYDLDSRDLNPRLVTFKMVLQHTVDVNAKNNKGETALHVLANDQLSGHMAKGRIEAAKLLIKKGADVSARDGDGKTAGDVFIQNDTDLMLRKDAELAQLLTDPGMK